MQSPEPYLIFTRKLQELGMRHMVSGSVAAIYYGEPRLTNDDGHHRLPAAGGRAPHHHLESEWTQVESWSE